MAFLLIASGTLLTMLAIIVLTPSLRDYWANASNQAWEDTGTFWRWAALSVAIVAAAIRVVLAILFQEPSDLVETLETLFWIAVVAGLITAFIFIKNLVAAPEKLSSEQAALIDAITRQEADLRRRLTDKEDRTARLEALGILKLQGDALLRSIKVDVMKGKPERASWVPCTIEYTAWRNRATHFIKDEFSIYDASIFLDDEGLDKPPAVAPDKEPEHPIPVYVFSTIEWLTYRLIRLRELIEVHRG